MKFGERLKSLRQEKGLTQQGLATSSGLSVHVVRNYEQGWRLPGWPAVAKLALALGTTSAVFDDCDEVRGASADPPGDVSEADR